MSTQKVEKRRTSRTRRSAPVWFRTSPRSEFHSAWMLEASDQGAAFVLRTQPAPRDGCLLEVSFDDPASVRRHTRSAVVRRTEHIHDNMILVAVQFTTIRAFPARVCVAAEPKPRRSFAFRRSTSIAEAMRRTPSLRPAA